jgi:hypothetical protein
MRWLWASGTAIAIASVLAGCGSSSAAPLRPGDMRLAARIAPTATVLGTGWDMRSGRPTVTRADCPTPATGCAVRIFALHGDPGSAVVADVQVFPTVSDAASAYATDKRDFSAAHTVTGREGSSTTSLQSEANRAFGNAHATLLVERTKYNVTKTRTATKVYRRVLVQRGRAQILLLYGSPAINFAATAHRLAARMRPTLR